MLKDISISFEAADILKRLGFKPISTQITPIAKDIIEREVMRLNGIILGRCVYCHIKIQNVSPSDDIIKISTKDNLVFKSRYLAGHLVNCSKITLMACTIGSELERESREFQMLGEDTKALVIDAIGSVAVELFTDTINNMINQEIIKAGYLYMSRFSPGYGDWKLEDQHIIFELLHPEDIGIKLTQGLIMVPEKSVTAIIGWKEGMSG